VRLAVLVHPDDIVVARQVSRRRKIPIGRSLRTAVSCNQVSATPLDGAYPVSPAVQGVAETLTLCDMWGMALLSHFPTRSLKTRMRRAADLLTQS